jgi:hypothetical protein
MVTVGGGGELVVSYDPSSVTPIGTVFATDAAPDVDLDQDDVLLEIRHRRTDSPDVVKAVFQVRDVGRGAPVTTTGGSGVRVFVDGTTTTVDLAPDIQEFTITMGDRAAGATPGGNAMSQWSEPPPTSTQASATAAQAPAQSLRMPIAGVRVIAGRGTMVTGKIEQGAVGSGDAVLLVAPGAIPVSSVVLGLEVAGKHADRAQTGDTVGVLLRGVPATAVTSGSVLRGLPARPFRMPVDAVRVIAGRGTMVTGKIEQGIIRPGDAVLVVAPGAKPISSVVTVLEAFGKVVPVAQMGDTVGLLLRGVPAADVTSGHAVEAL